MSARAVGTEHPHLILHIPHASRFIPPEVDSRLLMSAEALDAEQDRLVDHWTDMLFDGATVPHARCVATVSRFVVDVERFEQDADEPMSKVGMGVLYTLGTEGQPLRLPPEDDEREDLLGNFYRPHHARLELLVTDALAEHRHAMVIDCHSFPARALPCDVDRSADRPDICLGTDPAHTPASLVRSLEDVCKARGWSVGVNRPYAGTVVPLSRHRVDTRVSSVMIEVNRRLYLVDEPTDISKDPVGWPATKEGIDALLECACAWRA